MNSIKILQKCIAELQKPEPRLDYITGMLETMVEMQEPTAGSSNGRTGAFGTPNVGSIPTPAIDDDAAILDGMARAKLAAVKEMSSNG